MKWLYDSITPIEQRYHSGPYYEDSATRIGGALLSEMVDAGAIRRAQLVRTDRIQQFPDAAYCYAVSYRYYCGFHEFSEYAAAIRQGFAWLLDSPVLPLIRSGQALLVVYDHWEGEFFGVDLSVKRCDTLAEFLEVNPRHIMYTSDNLIIGKYADGTGTHIYPAHFFESTAHAFACGRLEEARTAVRQPIKPKRFLSYSRHWNDYRQYLNAELYIRDLLKHGLVSCSTGFHKDAAQDAKHMLEEAIHYWCQTEEEYEMEFAPRIPDFVKSLPYEIDTHLEENLCSTFMLEHYLKTDFSVVNETWTRSGSVFLSEKTWKAMIAKHPFLLFGNPGSLALLREHGYQTFSPVFDETYDEVEEMYMRKNMIIDQIQRFCVMPEKDRVKKMQALNEITEHNFRHLESRQLPFKWLIDKIEQVATENWH